MGMTNSRANRAYSAPTNRSLKAKIRMTVASVTIWTILASKSTPQIRQILGRSIGARRSPASVLSPLFTAP